MAILGNRHLQVTECEDRKIIFKLKTKSKKMNVVKIRRGPIEMLGQIGMNELIEVIKNEKFFKGVNILGLQELLRSETNKKTREIIKEKFPAFITSGIYSDNIRGVNTLGHNDSFVFDFDSLTETDIKELLQKSQQWKPCWVAFRSPGGEGVKLVVRTKGATVKNHVAVWLSIVEQMKLHLGEFKVDQSGKNINRLCFIPFDPEVIYRENVTAISVDDLKMVYPDFFSGRTKRINKWKMATTTPLF